MAKAAGVTTIPTQQQQEFIKLCAKGITPYKAAQEIYGPTHGAKGRELAETPHIRREIHRLYAQAAGRHQMTRTKVIDGFKRAAEMAEVMSDPNGMVAAWREIGKMLGYYAVETKKVELSVNGEIGVRKLTTLSDEDLLKLAAGQTLEGEFAQLVGEGADEPLSNSDLDEIEAL